MSGPQARRIQTLEDHAGGTIVTRMVEFVAATTGLTPAVVVAEAETILAASWGMTEAERNARLALDLGRTIDQVEDDLVEIQADFARWDRERSS